MEKTTIKNAAVKKSNNNFVSDLKNLFFSPIIHGIVGAVIFLSTMLVIKMFALRMVSNFNFMIDTQELVLTLLVGSFFFTVQLVTKIKLTKFYESYKK